MSPTDIKPIPVWQRVKRPRFERISGHGEFDVVVIGGGITGVTTAYLLKKAGKRVCLLERNRIGFVDTGLTTAHLTMVTDQRLPELVSKFGEEAAALAWQAGAQAINIIEANVNELEIDCQFHRVPGYLHESISGQRDESKYLEGDAEVARKLGFEAEFMEHVPYFNRPGVMFPSQAKFHPLKYLMAVAAAVEGGGCRVFEHAEVTEVQDDPQRVLVGEHEIKANRIVIATHVPLTGKTGLVNATLFQSKIYPYSSYVIGAKLPKRLVPDASFWDTTDPYYYLRVDPGSRNDYAIFGGKDHKTGQVDDTQQCFDQLRETLMNILPQAKPDRQWSGQVIETNDGLPYIGETAPGQFAATGFGGNGMTFGTIAATMARDYVLDRKNPWQELFSVDRKKLIAGGWDYVSENVDYPYYFVKDHLERPAAISPESLLPGEGKVIGIGGERVACSRGDDGELNAVSAICPHMGCVVHWNNGEKTWDCPCHGSRFQASGEVIGGPAESPLEKVSLDTGKIIKEEEEHSHSS
ncbi:FAD-dependent oxidoreductase [Anatilimnocola floriformis]|uniref:FAD-dependent oxidoreductase n=1 Tax=Anatilimnocola floriformis TaxID=2948575 RepID=UPI0020C52A08|nr:FAD-dependent oxidoreductase [Anatilimnocola floriformis]